VLIVFTQLSFMFVYYFIVECTFIILHRKNEDMKYSDETGLLWASCFREINGCLYQQLLKYYKATTFWLHLDLADSYPTHYVCIPVLVFYFWQGEVLIIVYSGDILYLMVRLFNALIKLLSRIELFKDNLYSLLNTVD